jgi:hypothetical protein
MGRLPSIPDITLTRGHIPRLQLMMMGVLFSVTGARRSDLIRRKRAQLGFIRFKTRTNNGGGKKESDGYESLFHALYSPLYVTMMQWLRPGREYRSLQ